jgi:para-aminobenzoate synthetase component 1
VQDLRNGVRRRLTGDPLRLASREFDRHRTGESGGGLPFAGGAIGHFSYDLRHTIERLPRRCHYDMGLPDLCLCFYDGGLVFDHLKGETYAVGRLAGEQLPAGLDERSSAGDVPATTLTPNFSRQGYEAAVRRAIDFIGAGDIFQVNLSQRFSGPRPGDGLAVYGRLRSVNPAPFSALLKYPEMEIACSSPERFLLLEGDRVTTRPIKGTRPRKKGDTAFNERMRRELKSSPKENAELAMIVDLERNDLGRVCDYGSVRVAEHAAIEAYPTVYHLVSTVTGDLYRRDHDEFDLIRAAFPGGSISGAPKIRAMEIIEELEPHARAIYTGAIGYISFHGRMDLNIVIRTIVITAGNAYVHVGGGIVADSDPAAEYRETLHKGMALFETLNCSNYADIMEGAFDESQ